MIPPTYGTRDADLPVDPGAAPKTAPIGKRVVFPPERLARAEQAERAVGVVFALGLILGSLIGASGFMIVDIYWPR